MAEKQCPKCKMIIDKGATRCPHCRSRVRTSAVTINGKVIWFGRELER